MQASSLSQSASASHASRHTPELGSPPHCTCAATLCAHVLPGKSAQPEAPLHALEQRPQMQLVSEPHSASSLHASSQLVLPPTLGLAAGSEQASAPPSDASSS